MQNKKSQYSGIVIVSKKLFDKSDMLSLLSSKNIPTFFALEQEWFNNDRNLNRYKSNQNNFHSLRLYARGEQSIQKYKDELSINGDLSYLNLDWKPIPIISKFVDIVVNGMTERMYDIKAYSQDPFGVNKRTEYMESILKDMEMRAFDA